MFKVYIKATDLIDRLRNDKDGVVSFEYVIVAACIVAVVAAAFGTGGTLPQALTGGLQAIAAALTTAVGAA